MTMQAIVVPQSACHSRPAASGNAAWPDVHSPRRVAWLLDRHQISMSDAYCIPDGRDGDHAGMTHLQTSGPLAF